jgi:hypothetical protein
MKISTITDPGKGFDILPYLAFLRIFLKRLHQNILFDNSKETGVVLIFKSSPGSSQSPNSHTPNSSSLIVPHAWAIANGELGKHFSRFASTVHPKLLSRLNALLMYAPEPNFPKTPSFPTGKLGTKEEPGKVRVFAMVD